MFMLLLAVHVLILFHFLMCFMVVFLRVTTQDGSRGQERQVQKLRNLHRRITLTLLTRTLLGLMAGVTMNGMMTGAWLDGMKVENKTMTTQQAHFSLGSFDVGAMSSPKRFARVTFNLDTGAAVITCSWNFGPDGAGDG